MSVKFTVKMNDKYMYDFFLHNTYTSLSGILAPILGVACLGAAIYAWVNNGFSSAMPTAFFAVLFLILEPLQMRSRAKMQVKNTPMFQKPLEYEADENGITVRQDEAEAVNKWEDIAKATVTKMSVIIYMNRVRAIILPKECIGEDYEAFIGLLCEHVPAKKIRMRKQ